MKPERIELFKPVRFEWRLPNQENPETGEPQIIRHNEDGPAVTTPFGYEAWYLNGLRHRDAGPAIEFEDFKAWYEHGKAHRIGGPAKVFTDGTEQWWENGVRIK